MKPVSTCRAASARSASILSLLMAVAAPAGAQVIEIADDGSARTYSKPTRFVGDESPGDVAATPGVRPSDVDRYQRAAEAEGIDVHLLRAVAWTESRGRQGAISPRGALGVMQLMPGTAAELGVDPLDPDANLHGGARYLARQLSRFQSLPLALAAYNAGPGAVLRWGGIPPYAETQAYVTKIMSRYQGTLANGALPASRALPRMVAIPTPRQADPMLIEVPSL